MKETFKTRIKVGNALQIPPRVLIGLGVGAGDRLDFRHAIHGNHGQQTCRDKNDPPVVSHDLINTLDDER